MLQRGTSSFGVLLSGRHGGSFGSRRVSFGAEFWDRRGGGQFRGAGESGEGGGGGGAGGGHGQTRNRDPKLTRKHGFRGRCVQS